MRELRLFLVILSFSFCRVVFAYAPEEGDILFQISRSQQSEAIQQATQSRYSHMGVVLFRKGQPYVLEASKTVRFTPLERWIQNGKNRHFVAKRYKSPLSDKQKILLSQEGQRYVGKPYDLRFEWSDGRMYCSELVWKIYQRALGIEIGQRLPIRAFHIDSPVVHQKMKERYGQHFPLDQKVIAPSTMFDSPLLIQVEDSSG